MLSYNTQYTIQYTIYKPMTDVNQLVNQAIQVLRGVGTSSAPIAHSQTLWQNIWGVAKILIQLIIIALEALVKILKLLVR